MPPAVATLIAIRNSEQQHEQLAAETTRRACGNHASCNVPTVAETQSQNLTALNQRVEELQTKVHALEVKQPAITLDDYFQFLGIAVFAVVVIMIAVAVSYPAEKWWKQRGVRRG